MMLTSVALLSIQNWARFSEQYAQRFNVAVRRLHELLGLCEDLLELDEAFAFRLFITAEGYQLRGYVGYVSSRVFPTLPMLVETLQPVIYRELARMQERVAAVEAEVRAVEAGELE